MQQLERLVQIMAQLRNPEGGCPWDLKQDFASIAPHTLEEAYEVTDVIERQAWAELPGELGDLLLQVLFHAQMASELGWFDFNDVATTLADKMVRRHPHVFANGKAESAEQVAQVWEQIKAQEQESQKQTGQSKQSSQDTSVLANVPVNLPALTRARKLQKKAAKVGFDWPDISGVWDKLAEEQQELQEAETQVHQEEELGDLLFVVVNLARHMDIDPEQALRRANMKFERRFKGVEQAVMESHRQLSECELTELDALWDQQKLQEKAEPNSD